MQSRKPLTEKAPSATDERRRKFLKTALAGTFAAPVVTSLAVDHLMNTARAQQAYVAPVVTGFARISPLPNSGTGAVEDAVYRVTFSQPIDPTSFRCWTATVYDETGCPGGGYILENFDGDHLTSGEYSWLSGNTVLELNPFDETGAGAHVLASGSVRLEVNGSCSGQLLGANGLPVAHFVGCVSYIQIN